jgi:hypothetical protein
MSQAEPQLYYACRLTGLEETQFLPPEKCASVTFVEARAVLHSRTSPLPKYREHFGAAGMTPDI